MFSRAATEANEHSVEGRQRAPGTRSRPRQNWAKWIALSVVGLVFLTSVGLAGAYELIYHQRVFPGVKMQGVDLSGLTQVEARKLIEAEIGGYLNTPITLQYEGRTWQITPGELGGKYNIEATVSAAFAVGRNSGIIAPLVRQIQTVGNGTVIHPELAIDDQKHAQALLGLAKEIDRPAVNAALMLDGTRVRLLPAQDGLNLDQQSLSKTLVAAFANMTVPPRDLPVKTVRPAIVDADLQEAKAKAEMMVSAPLTVQYVAEDTMWDNGLVQKSTKRSWTLSVEQIAGMLTFTSTETGGKLVTTPVLDQERLTAFGAQLAKEIDRKPQNARFDLREGQLTPTRPSLNGRTVDVPKVVALLAEKAGTSDRIVDLPVQIEKPSVSIDDMARIVVKDKIVERSTSYAGSTPERAHNVRLGASRLDGVVVAPGQEFSFLQEVGEMTTETGFQTGFAIIGTDTVPDVGGGICQVSTTLFQSVFYGGYEILERHPHAYRMVRYEPPAGLDATIYEGQLDFRFRNNSDNYVLIQSRSDDSRIYFALYGVSPDWQVTVDGPYLSNVVPADHTLITRETSGLAKGRQVQVEEPQDGVDVTIRRKVTKDGKELLNDIFFSRYRPEGNVVLVGTG